MKKGLCLLAAVASVCCASAFAGCGSAGKTGESLGLSYEKKYIYEWRDSYDNSSKESVLFHENGTGEFYGFLSAVGNDYTVTFRYLYYPEENTVFCFYDSVVYGDAHVGSDVSPVWSRAYFCTEELLTSGNKMFVCENYLPNIPNYGYEQKSVQ